MSDAVDPIEVAATVTGVLEALEIPHTIGGSLASSFAGEPRSTVDIDIVADLEERHVAPLIEALSADFYVDREALLRAIRSRTSANLVHNPTSLKVDLFVAGGTALDLQQIERRQPVTVGGYTLHVHPPEDILLQKLRWYQSGGGVSDRQWRDICAIIRVQGAALDRDYLRRNAPAIGVTDVLERALREN